MLRLMKQNNRISGAEALAFCSILGKAVKDEIVNGDLYLSFEDKESEENAINGLEAMGLVVERVLTAVAE